MSARSIADRRDRLRASLRQADVPALLVSSVANVGYLTGFLGDSSALVVAGERAVLVSDGRFAEQIEAECPGVEAHIRTLGQALTAAVAGVVNGLGVGRLGFEPSVLTVAEHEALVAAMPSVALKSVGGQVEALRMVKDDEEVAAIRHAIAIAERAFAQVCATLQPSDTEKEATDRLEAELRRCGASGSSFPPIVAAGANAARPHHHGTDSARLGDAEFVLIDWGADARPYKSDLTRVLYAGKVTPKFEAVYGAVLAAQARAIAAIRPGVSARAVDAEARAAIDEAGFGPRFTHGTGHGLGREVHEAPMLRAPSDVELQPGMVVTVEPGIYLPGWGGVRIEDDVLVTAGGCEVLTTAPKEAPGPLGW